MQTENIKILEKEEIYAKLFPDKPFIESKIDKLMSETKRLLERFILTQKYFAASNQPQQSLDMAAEMRLRGIEKRYFQALDKAKNYSNNLQLTALDNVLYKYMTAKEEQEWLITYNNSKSDLNIPQTIRSLEDHYYAQKTWMINHLLLVVQGTVINDSEHDQFSDWEVPPKYLKSSSFMEICWDIHLLFKTKIFEIADFKSLMEKIQRNEPSLDPESIANFYAYLRNLCVLLIDAGNIHFYPILFELNKDNLNRGYFYKSGKIYPNACLNITQTALNVKEVAWASAFVERHKDKITGENETQDFYRMNKALCLFSEKKYGQSLEMIPFGSTNSGYHLMARRLELKIYYELHSDLLDHKIDAFKMFISRAGRKVFSANLHELFTNFVNFVRQLSQSQGPQAKKRSQTLIKRINEKKMVAERLWLLEKAKELGEKR
ncbi:MAG: hypothetical protein IPH31_26820 [Lewinellaceae bacterium]|nr:hypothetical protein [Lewinellaceae bacterium]